MSKDYNQLLDDLMWKEDFKVIRARRLIKKGADPNYPIDENGRTIFMNAVDACEYQLVKFFLKRGAKIDITDNNGNNAFVYATLFSHSDMVKFLMKYGIDMEAENDSGDTVLMSALNTNYTDLNINNIRLIIEKGANVNHKNKRGMTPLEYAVRSKQKSAFTAVKLLLENGADISKCKYNLIQLIHKEANEPEKIREILKEYKVKAESFFIQYKLKVKCMECGTSNPINAPVQQLTCFHCQTNIKITDEIWQDIFEKNNGVMSCTDYEIDIKKSRKATICPNQKCKKEILLSDISVDKDDAIICKSCKEEISNYRAPDWLKKFSEYSATPALIIGAQELIPQTLSAVATKCISCGASMKIQKETPRLCHCEHCQTQQYLPDDIWLKLHPVNKRELWYILFKE